MGYRVVFVPGVPGSKLHDAGPNGSTGTKVFPPNIIDALQMTRSYKAKLKGPATPTAADGIVAGEPVPSTKLLGFDLAKHASSLYKLLARSGIQNSQLAKVGWDWRRPVTGGDTEQRLAEALENATDQVVIIAHSTGGLVVRHYLETHPAHAAKVGRVLAFGVPWAGTLKPLATLVGKQGFGPIGKKDAQEIFAHAWSAFDLLPRKSSGLVTTPDGTPVNLLTSHNWIPQGLGTVMQPRLNHSKTNYGEPKRTWQLADIPVTNMVGWGVETQVLAHIHGRDVTLNPGLQPEAKRLGDATVPLGSSAWLRGNVTTLSIPIGGYPRSGIQPHTTLWRNPGGADIVRHILGAQHLSEFAYAAADWSDKIDPGRQTVRIRFVLQGLDGAPLAGGIARLANVQGHKEAGVDGAGRGMISESRAKIPKTQDRKFRRLRVELQWPGVAKPKPQTLLFVP